MQWMTTVSVLLVAVAACTGQDPGETTPPGATQDIDGDGFGPDLDCAEGSASVFPGAEERCNGIDDDCDGEIDEADAVDARSGYPDDDGDGFGDPAREARGCDVPEGLIETAGDCDDTDEDVNPDAVEVCDTVDNDCDGQIDADDPDPDAEVLTYYVDSDGDGFGDPAVALRTCDEPEGYVLDASDCDDEASAVNPEAVERYGNAVDEDCDSETVPPAVDICPPAGAQVPGDYADIQAALADGQGTICLAASTYAESADCGDTRCTIVGQGPDHTEVTGAIDGSHLILEGLTIRGGVSGGPDGEYRHLVVGCGTRDEALLTGDLTVPGVTTLDRVDASCPGGTATRLGVAHLVDVGTSSTATVRNSWFHDAAIGLQIVGTGQSSGTRASVFVLGSTLDDNGIGLDTQVELSTTRLRLSLYNLLYVDNETGWRTEPISLALGATHANNAFHRNTVDLAGGVAVGANYVFDDPGLDRSFSPARPGAGSVLVGAGLASELTLEDFWGAERNAKAPTIGAVEALEGDPEEKKAP